MHVSFLPAVCHEVPYNTDQEREMCKKLGKGEVISVKSPQQWIMSVYIPSFSTLQLLVSFMRSCGKSMH